MFFTFLVPYFSSAKIKNPPHPNSDHPDTPPPTFRLPSSHTKGITTFPPVPVYPVIVTLLVLVSIV
jgi:hypothetical protein